MLAEEENRILVNSQAGCSSVVGRVGGIQTLSFEQRCKDVGVIIHEFMHALGVGHTQSHNIYSWRCRFHQCLIQLR